MSTERSQPNTRYKVGRVVVEYDLLDLHDRLPELWRGKDSRSLRELADDINIAILESALRSAGEDPLDGEAENSYRLLTDDDVSPGVRTELRNRLERSGVNVHNLEDNFVTHQAVHTYLTNVFELTKTPARQSTKAKHDERLRRLRSRTTAVMEHSLEELQSHDEVTIGRYDCSVEMNVYCRDCNTQYDILSLLESGGCECEK